MDDIDTESDEISLLDLAAVLWRWKRLIIGITGLISIAVFIYVFVGKIMEPEKSIMPDVYTSTAFMRIQNDKSNAGAGGLSALLQQNAVANLAGLGTGMSGNSAQQLALYIAGSNSFLDAIADELKIVEKYKIRKFL